MMASAACIRPATSPPTCGCRVSTPPPGSDFTYGRPAPSGQEQAESLVTRAVHEIRREETEVECEVTGLVWIYTDPKHVIVYTATVRSAESSLSCSPPGRHACLLVRRRARARVHTRTSRRRMEGLGTSARNTLGAT
jgi:hypothetical protein